MKERSEPEDSPTHCSSQQIVSDDDEIDYSIKPEFYDSKLDENDELWAQKQRRGHTSDAVLSCPACFTTLCLDCQRHEKYVSQYRAIFVVNCRIKVEEASEAGSLSFLECSPERSLMILFPKREKKEKGKNARLIFCIIISNVLGILTCKSVYTKFNFVVFL
ncbi:hypothetical protein BUALT_Bualt10G0040900 [Buddleja alternifolia]|uniref:E2F-associated phosphoprotein n=1 Tax=Buddleja alternifolia TaxID=168488 RepID=A0AAV6WXN6_9LAMI|nr:hypothetical protein BUALT_Bualt10G0040900 [Buddleja alternifolia]